MRALNLKYNTSELNTLEKEIDQIQLAVDNPSAFEPLYNKYYKQIFLFIFKRTADESLAEDLTSQVFFNAMTKLHQFKFQGAPFSSWLYRIAYNEILLHYRSEKTKRKVHAALRDVDALIDEIGEIETNEERLSLLKSGLSHLSEEELQLIEMKYFEHKQYQEIADITGLSVSNAKVKVHRIIKKLNKLVSNERS